MRILFRTKRQSGITTEMIVPMRLQEAAAVWKLVASGTLRDIWFSPDGPTVFGMLECESLEAAQEIMRALPMPAAGLIDFDFFRLQPYDQFGLLFRDEFK